MVGMHGMRVQGGAEGGKDTYLSPSNALLRRKPALPTKPCRVTSTLVGKAYIAEGQAGASLHSMVVLQTYQANLKKDLEFG